MTKYSLQTRAADMLENMSIERYMLVGWVEPEALLSILWTVFYDARMFMGVACAKADLLDPRGIRPRIQSIRGLIRNMESDIIPRRDNISWEFRKEYLFQMRKDT